MLHRHRLPLNLQHINRPSENHKITDDIRLAMDYSQTTMLTVCISVLPQLNLGSISCAETTPGLYSSTDVCVDVCS